MALDVAANGSRGSITPIRTISVVAPLRNEGPNVDHFVSDLAAQDFSGELEVLVADGGSDDGSAERLRAAAGAAGIALRVIDNPARLGLARPERLHPRGARRPDRPARLPLALPVRLPAPLRRAVRADRRLERRRPLVPTGTTPTERAVACAMDSPFGGIGWTRCGGDGPRRDRHGHLRRLPA